MVGKRHDADEIDAKLAEASHLAAAGRPQQEICRALGVSVMTYYRWRKMRGRQAGEALLVPSRSTVTTSANELTARTSFAKEVDQRLRDLEIENARLRRLVTDLLLEKLEHEEKAETNGQRHQVT